MDGSKLQTIPKFLRSEPSPRIQDSAFPPFKIEHRYRGVYERAGFDVYKGDPNNRYANRGRSGNSTPRTRAESSFSSNSNHSVISPRNQQFERGSFDKRALKSAESVNPYDRPVNQVYPSSRNKSSGDIYTQASRGSGSGGGTPTSYSFRNQSVPNTAVATTFDHPREPEVFDHNKNYSGATVVPSIEDHKQDASNLNVDQVVNKRSSSFNFSPSSASHKNYMGLSLDLDGHSQDAIDGAPFTDDTADEGNETNPSNKFDSYDNGLDDQNLTSATSLRMSNEIDQAASVQTDELLDTPERRRQKLDGSNPHTGPVDNSLVKKERLSAALVGMHNDYNEPHYKQNTQPQFHIEEPRLSYSEQPQNPYGVSSQFETFKQEQEQESNNLNVDYQNFLNGSNPQNPRQSNLSMVSSIISKESRYSDEEDAEVQQELERQLESLKNGGSSELLSNISRSQQNLLGPQSPEKNQRFEDPESPVKETPKAVSDSPYPTNFPEEIDDIDSPAIGHDEEVPISPEQAVPTFNIAPSTPPEADIESIESIKPLSVRHSKIKNTFELPDISKTPKVAGHTQFVDDELPDVQNTPQVEEQVDQMTQGLQEVKLQRKSVPAFKYPSGSGPCRACNQLISPEGKGPKKAVYSKTGELTGQWHRECFTCAHEECTVQFNKSVQCYVLDDEAYCSHHYHSLNHTLCELCCLGIEGECIENELSQKWHLHCLRCLKCNNVINSDYYLINDGIYCDHDAINIISGQDVYNDGNGNTRNGLTTNDKVEKRRTRLMHIDQY